MKAPKDYEMIAVCTHIGDISAKEYYFAVPAELTNVAFNRFALVGDYENPSVVIVNRIAKRDEIEELIPFKIKSRLIAVLSISKEDAADVAVYSKLKHEIFENNKALNNIIDKLEIPRLPFG